ncbi:MAG TPA: hypothetical protein VFB84_06535 [Micromonosporaceae bacterium]|nr:hypothetical protein [Micromonosporaceae bacterium]
MIPVGAGDIIALVEKGRSLYGYVRSKRTRDIAAGATGARALPELYDSLRVLYYDVPVLAGPDGPFPMGVLPLTPEAQADPELLLGRVVNPPIERPVYERKVLEAIKKRGATIWNGRTFSLAELRIDAQERAVSMDAYLGSYFDMVCSADYLEYEMLAALVRSSFRSIGLDDLPARSRALARAADPMSCLLGGGGVDAAISISTLVVYKRRDRYWMICEVRSDLVAEYGALYHVAPSFIFQPVVSPTRDNLKTEWCIQHNIFREYLEELFDVPEAQMSKRSMSAEYFYAHPNLLYLRSLLAEGGARLSGIALSFNLLSHRPEICTLLIIEDERWFETQKDRFLAAGAGLSYLCLNEEFRTAEHDGASTTLERVTTLAVDDPYWSNIVRPWSMVPQGAPALVLGAKAACRELNIAEPDWLSRMSIDPGRPSPLQL